MIACALLLFRRYLAVWRAVQIISRTASRDCQEIGARTTIASEKIADRRLRLVRPCSDKQMVSAADKREAAYP